MKLGVIVLLRNEADIFPAFAQHLAALFDHALFLDHGSTDGTRAQIDAACAGRPGWRRWRIAIPSFHQSLFTTFALRHVFADTDADAVFLLDADEFIDVADRGALVALLAGAGDVRCVPCLAWRNVVPDPLHAVPLRIGDGVLAAPGLSVFTKVIVTRALYQATGGALKPLGGNHVIDPGDGVPLTASVVGILLHVPLRSVAQMTRKTMVAALGHLGRSDRPAHEGSHRFAGLARIAARGLHEDDLRGWAAAYGEVDDPAPCSAADLRRLGFSARVLDVAHAGAPVRAEAGQSLEAALAGALLAWRPRASAGLRLVLDGDVVKEGLLS
jgi:hypothetical protein